MKHPTTRFALLISLIAACQSPASQLVDHLKAGKDQTLVVYGTSLTAGGQWVKDTKAWLETINPAAKLTLVNSAQSGKNSLVGIEKLDAVVIAKKPDTVLIEFAVNDAFVYPEKEKIVSVEQSQKNLELMVSRIKKALPDTEIIIQTMNPAWDAPNGNGSASKRPELASYYEGYRQTAAKLGLQLIDHNKNWVELQKKDEEKFKKSIADGVHPTAAASTEVTFPQVKASLSEETPAKKK